MSGLSAYGALRLVDGLVRADREGAAAVTVFAPDAPCVAGHFPANPLVPGTMLVQTAKQVAELWLVAGSEADWRLTGVREARFRSPVLPGSAVAVEVAVGDRAEGRLTVSFRISSAGRLCAFGQFLYARRPAC